MGAFDTSFDPSFSTADTSMAWNQQGTPNSAAAFSDWSQYAATQPMGGSGFNASNLGANIPDYTQDPFASYSAASQSSANQPSASTGVPTYQSANISGYQTPNGNSTTPSQKFNTAGMDNAARSAAAGMATSDRNAAMGYISSGAKTAMNELQPWQAQLKMLQDNPQVISDAIKNLMLGRIFNKIDTDTMSSVNRLSQMYAQTGRSVNPAVLMRLNDQATADKSNQARELEITQALENRQGTERLATMLGSLGQAQGAISQNESKGLAGMLADTNYTLPNNSENLAAMLRSA